MLNILHRCDRTQNSNTAAKLFAKAINIDLKPILEEKKLWAPGIDGHLDHTNMDKLVHM